MIRRMSSFMRLFLVVIAVLFLPALSQAQDTDAEPAAGPVLFSTPLMP